MVLCRVDVVLRLVKIWGDRGDEFRTSGVEELLKDGKGVKAAALHALKLIPVFLTKGSMNSVVEASRAEGNAYGDQSVHLVVLLCDRVELSILLEVLCPRDVDKNVGKGLDGIGVTAHHHVAKTNIVVSILTR